MNPSQKKREETLDQKWLSLGLFPSRNFSVRNLKNYYLKEDLDLRFFFDFRVNEKIVEIKSFRKIRRNILQNLLIKSRLIRYQMIGDRIVRGPPIRMILIINGDIKGPEYDRLRNFRMLTIAGWDVYPFSLVTNDRKFREVFRND